MGPDESPAPTFLNPRPDFRKRANIPALRPMESYWNFRNAKVLIRGGGVMVDSG
jgi:hypothetical protein